MLNILLGAAALILIGASIAVYVSFLKFCQIVASLSLEEAGVYKIFDQDENNLNLFQRRIYKSVFWGDYSMIPDGACREKAEKLTFHLRALFFASILFVMVIVFTYG